MYGNCRLRIVQGNEVCRCAILPRSLRPASRVSDQDTGITGSVGTMTPMPADMRGAVGSFNRGGSPATY
jgi:hypothetical protein